MTPSRVVRCSCSSGGGVAAVDSGREVGGREGESRTARRATSLFATWEWSGTEPTFSARHGGLGIVSCLLQRGRNPAHGSETAATTRTGIGLVSRHHRYRHLGSFSFSLTMRLLEMSPLYTITAVVSQARARSLMCENFFELNDPMPGRHQVVVSSSLTTGQIPLFFQNTEVRWWLLLFLLSLASDYTKKKWGSRSILCRLPLCDKFLITGEMELWSFVSNATATRVSRGTLLYTEKIIQS